MISQIIGELFPTFCESFTHETRKEFITRTLVLENGVQILAARTVIEILVLLK